LLLVRVIRGVLRQAQGLQHEDPAKSDGGH
jgi:hypothetical protein